MGGEGPHNVLREQFTRLIPLVIVFFRPKSVPPRVDEVWWIVHVFLKKVNQAILRRILFDSPLI